MFLGHGLAVAFFTLTAVLASVTFWRTGGRIWLLRSGWIVAYLGFLLLLCKTVSVYIFAAFACPILRWSTPRTQSRIAVILAALVLLYPVLRTVDLVPITPLLEISQAVMPDRAKSLALRFDQEHQLLQRALERPMLGWGRFGRSEIYDIYGKDISVTDGRWIITLGQFGLIGFLAEFGLLALPIFQLARKINLPIPSKQKMYLASLALLLAINLVDLLPNAALNSWTWLLAGALSGSVASFRALAPRKQTPNVIEGIEKEAIQG